MKRTKAALLIMAAAIVMSLTACGKKAPAGVPDNNKQEEMSVEEESPERDGRIDEDFYAEKPQDLTDLEAVMDYLGEKLDVEWITETEGQHNGVWETDDGHRVNFSLYSEEYALKSFSISSSAENGKADTYAVDIFAPFFCRDEDVEKLREAVDRGEIQNGDAVFEVSTTPFETYFYMYFGDYYEKDDAENSGKDADDNTSMPGQEDNTGSGHMSSDGSGEFTGGTGLKVSIDGHVYQFPMQVKELEANGWKIGGYTRDWTDGSYLPYYEKVESGEGTGQQFVRSGVTNWEDARDRISFEAFNPGDEPCDYSDLWIYDINSDCQGETIPFDILGISGTDTSDEEFAKAVEEGMLFVHMKDTYMDPIEVEFSYWGDGDNRDFQIRMNREDIKEVLKNRAEVKIY